VHKIIPFTIVAAALCLHAPTVMAQESDPQAPSEVVPGDETSDRTPEEETPTPDAQVDQTKEGETSDRTPSKHDEDKTDE
jgi:hypothetical protein